MALPYISRLLMEEGTDDHFFFLYPDHPALLRAEQPFAQILVDVVHSAGSASALSPSSSSDATASATSASPQISFDGNCLLPGDQDMLNLAFLKGMEEAQKFLPPNIGPTFTATEEEAPAGGGLKKKRDRLEPEAKLVEAKKKSPGAVY